MSNLSIRHLPKEKYKPGEIVSVSRNELAGDTTGKKQHAQEECSELCEARGSVHSLYPFHEEPLYFSAETNSRIRVRPFWITSREVTKLMRR